MRVRVGFDLDGCLYDFGNSVRAYLDSIGREYGWKDNKEEPHHWDFYEYWHMDRSEFTQICHDGVDAGYIFSGGVRPNAIEAVQKVRDLGHEIVIITDRSFGTEPARSHDATREWLKQHDIPYDELHFTPDKTIVPTDFFVEDKLENYDALTKAGTNTFLITRDWNLDPMSGVNDDRQRICDVIEYAWAVEGLTKSLLV